MPPIAFFYSNVELFVYYYHCLWFSCGCRVANNEKKEPALGLVPCSNLFISRSGYALSLSINDLLTITFTARCKTRSSTGVPPCSSPSISRSISGDDSMRILLP